MSLLLETIKLSDKNPQRLSYHQIRMNNSYFKLFGAPCPFNLQDYIKTIKDIPSGVVKLRIEYNALTINSSWSSYIRKDIKSLRPVLSDEISYALKFANRDALNALYQKKGSADDILIVKNELITDSWYCNVALLKNEKWLTPVTPLLAGTQRHFLLDKQILTPALIYLSEISQFEKICLFNSMIEFGEIILPISAIKK